MPNRADQAQKERDHGYHLLKKAAAAEAELDLAETFEAERQFWASLALQHEERARFAHLQADECARRMMTHLIQAEPPEPTPLPAKAR